MIRLERNYRSTGHILAAASHLIAHNEGRLGKTLRTEDEPGEKVAVTGAWDSEEEARAIGEEIEQLQRQTATPLDEIAILVRASFQMREFEDRFVTLGLPYRVIGGPRFYERAEIRDALAYLRWSIRRPTISPSSASSTCPSAGSATPPCKLLHDHARKRRVPLTEAARAMVATDELKPKPRGALARLDRGVRPLARRSAIALPHTELAEIVLDESGYTEMWQKDRSADAAGRLENLKELVRSMEEFENLQGFLEHISLVMDTDSGAEADAVIDHDAAFGQGAGIRHRVPARLGGRPVSAPALARRSGPRRAGGGAPPRPCRPDARAQAREDLFRLQPPHARPVASTIPSRFLDELPEPHVEVTEAKGGGSAAIGGLRRLALRQPRRVRLELPHARLAARASARKAGGSGADGFAEPDDAAYDADDARDETRLAAALRGRTAPPRGRRSTARRAMPLTIEGELVAKSTGTVSAFTLGDRVFHQKFGNGNVTASTATSSPSRSTTPARSAWWIVLSSGCEGR